jgi:hypothetical protein
MEMHDVLFAALAAALRLGLRAGLVMPPALGFDLVEELVLKLLKQLFAIATLQLTLQLPQSKADHMIMVKSPEFGVRGDLQPELVKQLQILWAEARRMRSERINIGAAVRENHLKFEAGARLGKALPSVPCKLGLFVGGKLISLLPYERITLQFPDGTAYIIENYEAQGQHPASLSIEKVW